MLLKVLVGVFFLVPAGVILLLVRDELSDQDLELLLRDLTVEGHRILDGETASGERDCSPLRSRVRKDSVD